MRSSEPPNVGRERIHLGGDEPRAIIGPPQRGRLAHDCVVQRHDVDHLAPQRNRRASVRLERSAETTM